MFPYYETGVPFMKTIFNRWQARKALPTKHIPLSRAEGVDFGDKTILQITQLLCVAEGRGRRNGSCISLFRTFVLIQKYQKIKAKRMPPALPSS